MEFKAIHQLLCEQPLVALFAIIACGLLLGKLSIKGIQLGTSGVIFAALLAGHIGYTIPMGVGPLGNSRDRFTQHIRFFLFEKCGFYTPFSNKILEFVRDLPTENVGSIEKELDEPELMRQRDVLYNYRIF